MQQRSPLITCFFKHKEGGCCTDTSCANEMVALCSGANFIHAELYLWPVGKAVRVEEDLRLVKLLKINAQKVYHRHETPYEGFDLMLTRAEYEQILQFCVCRQDEAFSSRILWCLPLRQWWCCCCCWCCCYYCCYCCNSTDRYWSVSRHPQKTWICSTLTATALGAAENVFRERATRNTLGVSPSQLYCWFADDGKRDEIFSVPVVRRWFCNSP